MAALLSGPSGPESAWNGAVFEASFQFAQIVKFTQKFEPVHKSKDK
jgi:hypothetical protein